MGKKMKLPSLLKNTSVASSSSSSSSWAWPSCHQPKTHSFRATKEIFKTYFDATVTAMDTLLLNTSEDSFFTVSPDSTIFSTTSDDDYSPSTKDESSLETVIRGLRHRSDRLFFDPDDASSIIEAKSVTATGTAGASSSLPLFKDSVALSMESRDPYVDFRKSMEEMVEAHGVKDWEGLEALLGWYLKANGKSNHGYIVGAFVDLLVSLTLASSSSSSSTTTTTTTTSTSSSSDSPSSSSYSPSSPLSFYSSSLSSSCVSCLEAEQEQQEVDDGNDNDTPPASSSSLLEQDKEEIKYEDVAASSSSSSSKV